MTANISLQSAKFIELVCPHCRSELSVRNGESLECGSCGKQFSYLGEFPDLIVGERFDDQSDEGLLDYEESSNRYLTENYWLPLFRKLWPETEKITLLSCGCGTGMDVDLLAENGVDTIGIDCGNRTQVWHRRKYKERLLLANGKHLPFKDETFHGAFCGCVFPHVGVVGDSNVLRQDFWQERFSLAQELTRVVKREGKLVLASPNRLFPLDIFHGRVAGSYKPRLNPPWSRFLLSLKDYRQLFEQAGCSKVETLPIENYWGFVRARNSLKGLLFSIPVSIVFKLVSMNAFKALRNSVLNPWLVVLITR